MHILIDAEPIAPVFMPKLFTNLENYEYEQPGNTGDTGGGSEKPHGTYTLTPGPGTLDVQVMPAAPYNNFYFYTNLQTASEQSRFVWGGGWCFPTEADRSASQGLEWEIELCLGGDVWNMAWQILLKPGSNEKQGFRAFDYTHSKWVAVPAVPFDPHWLDPGKILICEAEYISGRTAEQHVALTVNGNRTPVTFSQPCRADRWDAHSNYVHYAFQLDADGGATPYRAVLHGLKAQVL